MLLTGSFSASGQVVINEVCSSNGGVVLDEEQNPEDFIELYNRGSNAVNLEGYYFETFDDQQRRWYFPKIIIEPDGCLIIFCSKKDKTEIVHHFELLPWWAWRYFVGVVEPDTTWPDANYDDSGWLLGVSPIGYNEDSVETVIMPNPVISYYIRDTFQLTNIDKINAGLMLIDYDDAFVAYINGVEIARSYNIGTPGVRPPYNAWASDEHDARVGSPGCPDPFGCTEFFFTGKDVMQQAVVDGQNALGFQVHNSELTLADQNVWPVMLIGSKDTTTVCPDCIFILPWNDYFHTNFNLDSKGQRVTLYDNNGKVVDEIIIEEMRLNHSWGRFPDGEDSWCLMENPTPCGPNDGSDCKDGYAGTPKFSLIAGFYNGSQQVAITATNSSDSIYYTTNGDWPTQNSKPYVGPITINTTTVLRATQFSSDQDILPGYAATATYFIDDKPTLPVVTVTTDSLLLFDQTYGLYMLGPNVDTNTMVFPYWGVANYYKDDELQGHVEYFDSKGGLGLSQICGIKIHGNFSRGWPQKSFRFLANDKYGDTDFDFKPFPDKDISRFKSFNVRNSGVDANTTHFRDGLMNRAVRSTHVDFMDHQSCVVYVNGRYWGVYGIRERQDEHYIAENHKIHPDHVEVLRFTGEVQHGKIGISDKRFFDMADFISNTDMSIQSNYDSASSYWDIKNYCDYFIAETYYLNGDWIGENGANNIRFWRSKLSGKWRYILWDTDLGLNLIGSNPVFPSSVSHDWLAQILSPTYVTPHSNMLRNFLNNQEFKEYFINRYADLINTTLKPEVFGGVAQDIYDEMAPEMDRHFQQWGAPPKLIWEILTLGRSSNVVEWTNEFDSMMFFINERPFHVRNNLESYFNLNKQVDVTLDVKPAGAGKIMISTIIPEPYPWTGVYFDGVPVTMTVIPNPGYVFKHWKSNVLITSPDSNTSITLNIDADDAFTAYFEAIDFDVMVYPNPFSNTTTLRYLLPKETQVSLKLFDLMGKEVFIFSDYTSFKQEGEHIIVLDPKQYNLPMGLYMLEFKTPNFRKTIKLTRVGTE